MAEGQIQLFVDDERIARKEGVVRRTHPCSKLPAPVLTAQHPPEGRRVYVYGTVLRDAASGSLRMWYMSDLNYVLYAESADGLQWRRPSLGVWPHEPSADNNIVYLLHSPSVILDAAEANPRWRYKMLGCGKAPGSGYHVAHSADGLRWSAYPKNPVLSGADTCTLAHDAPAGEYLAFHKLTHPHRGHRRRLVYLSVSKDMQDWSPPVLAMAPDEIDDQRTREEGGLFSQFYNMSAFRCGGQWLGLVTHFRHSRRLEQAAPGQSRDDGPIDVQLVHSRDGRNWRRCEDRSPVIPNGPGEYDAGCILGVANSPVFVGDQMWIYYTAINTPHGGAMPAKQVTIARAAWRRDRWVSLDAGSAGGVVETVPLPAAGGRLFVNADASGGGELRVELADETRRPLGGYGADACEPVCGDQVRQAVRWRLHGSLPADREFCLRFHMKNVCLFSYRIE